MVFSSLVFVFLFLPVTIILYKTVRENLKNKVLLAASLLFYAWGEPALILIMLVSIGVNFLMAKLVDMYRDDLPKKRFYLLVSIVLNLGLLVFFKYYGFLLGNFNRIFSLNLPLPSIIMPIGISFYTFQAMSYVIDVYRNEVRANDSLVNVALYIAFFPQLIAGPIVRYKDINEQLAKRDESLELFGEGVRLFVFGLSKKLIIANIAGRLADRIFALDYGALPVATAWLGVLAYSLQIFFDFSGYSTIAIGLGKLFGFNFNINFNYPYIARDIQDFWRRWHISLSTWFRDYLYIPLGGNRKGQIRTIMNQFIVFLLCGFWHGAGWSFIFWGAYHGGLLSLERIGAIRKFRARLPYGISWAITIILVMVGWVFFRIEGFSSALRYLGSMFGFSGRLLGPLEFSSLDCLILLAGMIASVPWGEALKIKLNRRVKILQTVMLFALSGINMLLLVSSTYNPFIYFRF